MTDSWDFTITRQRRLLARSLSALWIIDAFLKLQPGMFTPRIIANVLAPAAVDEQPQWLAAVMQAGDTLWAQHMAVAEIATFLIELSIGLLIWRAAGQNRASRLGLWLSIGWGLIVWVFAEGLGGILTGDASFLAGAPGSALVYMAMAGLLLVPVSRWQSGQVAQWLRYGLGVFWLVMAVWQGLPHGPFWTGPGMGGIFGNITMNGPEPVLLQQMINDMVLSGMGHPVLYNGVFVAIMLVLGVAYLSPRRGRIILVVNMLFLAFAWAVPQAFGGLFTGTGTDPGLYVPLAVLTYIAWQLLTPGAPSALSA